MDELTLILGAGMTGLAAGLASGCPVFEAAGSPGGICSSYYRRPGTAQRLAAPPADGEAYRFEIGGGHWIFGADPSVRRFIEDLAPTKTYERRSGVWLSQRQLHMPYPIQNHLGWLDKKLAAQALAEILDRPKGNPSTMAEWLDQSFGSTLMNLFFGPFHERYTAGLWTRIAPQDAYKSPVEVSLARQGALRQTTPVGYNATFVYPRDGLNALAGRMAARADVRYGKRVSRIDVRSKEVQFADGAAVPYDRLASTLPLNRMMEMTGLAVDEPTDPHTGVLVLNLGARRGPKCPDDHWLYVPDSQAGFYRVGFYSNVDAAFLPLSSRTRKDRVGVYVERAYGPEEKPTPSEIDQYAAAVVAELQEWDFLGDAEVVDPTWIDVAYTWSYPKSTWRARALRQLDDHDIVMVGRYGRWQFQGIADSIRDGLFVGATLKPGEGDRRP